MIILSVADFHTQAVDKKDDRCIPNIELQDSVRFFGKFMSELRDREPEWVPDYLCICGDIAYSGKTYEYDLAKEIINQLAQVCFLSNDYLLMVPGNHDMDASLMLERVEGRNKLKEKEKNRYLLSVENLFNKKIVDIDKEILCRAFKSYSDFRKSFVKDSVPYHTFPSTYVPSSISHTCGYKIFKKNKTVFVELNSSWLDLPKLEVSNAMRFGDLHIQWLYNQIKELKQQGFYIVTMFHHSLRYLDLKEYQTRDPQFPVYDRIIEMSDLCLSGHEHGSKSKEPDMLGNACQYILNGGFYSPDTHNRVMESSASLIKVDLNNEQLTIRRFLKDTDGTWQEGRAPKTYSIHSRLRNEIVDQKMHSRFTNIIGFGSTDKRRFYDRVILKYFGNDYEICVTEKPDKFKLVNKVKNAMVPSHYVTFLEMDHKITEISLEDEPGVLLIVICLCRPDKEMDIQTYSDLKNKYKKEIMKQKMIFFALSVDF